MSRARTETIKTDNANLPMKARLRSDNLPKGKKVIKVLDCYHGSGAVWRAVAILQAERTRNGGSKMKVIYEPKGRAREYSPLALNIYKGCDHDCSYCYIKTMPFSMGDNTAPVPMKNLLDNLRKDMKVCPKDVQVLLSFIGDPYCKANDTQKVTRQVLEILCTAGIKTAILTKGGTRCLQDLDIFQQMVRDRAWLDSKTAIKVGATMVFDNNTDQSQYEPGAASPQNRMEALQNLHMAGIKTWVSLEPVMDPVQSLRIIDDTHDFVDFYKVGVINHFPNPQPIDWPDFANRAIEKLRKYGNLFFVKHDLQKHLAPGHGLPASALDMNYLPSL